MIKVCPFIDTMGTEKFKKFLNLPFFTNMLYPFETDNDLVKKIKVLFHGWDGEFTENLKIVNNTEITIIFDSESPKYEIKKVRKGFKIEFPLPQTINDFINDMTRLQVDLYWVDWVEEHFEPKDFLPQNEISKYYTDLLNKMEKGHELQLDEEDE